MDAGSIFETVAIVGPGLVGGSLGIALRARGLAGRVVGVGRREASLQEALAVGAVDEVTLDVREGVRAADLVVLATPISAFGRVMRDAADAMKGGALLTDVASTKQQVIQTITRALEGRPDVAYVPTHPMAGGERRGAGNAEADLFERSVCILTPLPHNRQPDLDRIRALWAAVGAKVHTMSPSEHDRLVARISHLPHLAAAALLRAIEAEEGALAGGGLMDTTRIASGDPALWRDICETNPSEISAALDAYIEILERIHGMIASGDFGGVQSLLCEAKQERDGLLRDNADRWPPADNS